jgi:hypothetical protein
MDQLENKQLANLRRRLIEYLKIAPLEIIGKVAVYVKVKLGADVKVQKDIEKKFLE